MPLEGQSVKCPKCGYENPPSAKFCMECGARLVKKQPVELKLGEAERTLLKAIFAISLLMLILELSFNRLLHVLVSTPIIGGAVGFSYVLGIALSLYMLTVLRRKVSLSHIESIAMILAIVVPLAGTLATYLISVFTIRTYSPLWVVYAVALATIWRAYRERG